VVIGGGSLAWKPRMRCASSACTRTSWSAHPA
jgi:hypothetical protein